MCCKVAALYGGHVGSPLLVSLYEITDKPKSDKASPCGIQPLFLQFAQNRAIRSQLPSKVLRSQPLNPGAVRIPLIIAVSPLKDNTPSGAKVIPHWYRQPTGHKSLFLVTFRPKIRKNYPSHRRPKKNQGALPSFTARQSPKKDREGETQSPHKYFSFNSLRSHRSPSSRPLAPTLQRFAHL